MLDLAGNVWYDMNREICRKLRDIYQAVLNVLHCYKTGFRDCGVNLRIKNSVYSKSFTVTKGTENNRSQRDYFNL